MDLWDLTKLLFRRWYVSVPLFLICMVGVAVASLVVKPDYSATGHLQMIPPRNQSSDTTPAVRNPWNDLGYEALANAAMIDVTNKATLDALVAQGLTDNVTVTLDRTPMFVIEAVGNSPKQATETVQRVQRLLSEAVVRRQQAFNVPSEHMITTIALDDGSDVEMRTSKIIRVLVVAAGVGMLITAGATIGVDALIRRRQRRRAGEHPDWQASAPSPASRMSGEPRPHDDSSWRRPQVPVMPPVVRPVANGGYGLGRESAELPAGVGHAGMGQPSAPQHGPSEITVTNYEEDRPNAAVTTDPQRSAPAPDDPTNVPPDATIVLPLSHLRHSRGDRDDAR